MYLCGIFLSLIIRPRNLAANLGEYELDSHVGGCFEDERLHQLDVVSVFAEDASQAAVTDGVDLCWRMSGDKTLCTG